MLYNVGNFLHSILKTMESICYGVFHEALSCGGFIKTEALHA